MTTTTVVPSPIIIALSGPIGSGKTTTSDNIASTIEGFGGPVRVYQLCFADHLKKMASEMFHFPISLCSTQEGKNRVIHYQGIQMTVGQILQKLGQGMRDLFGDDFWVNKLVYDIQRIRGEVPGQLVVVVGDLRYKNEETALRLLGASFVRLEGDPDGVRARSTRDMSHPSENSLADFSRYLVIDTDARDAIKVAAQCVELVKQRLMGDD